MSRTKDEKRALSWQQIKICEGFIRPFIFLELRLILHFIVLGLFVEGRIILQIKIIAPMLIVCDSSSPGH